jgi:hypothetical protein
MALKFRYKSKEEVPAEVQSPYTERDGAFVLDVEGAVDKSRVEEVRAKNIALASQLAEQRKRFEAIESEQVKTIAAERVSLNAKLTAIQVNQGVLAVATKKGLRPTAIPDITARARVVFRLVNGALHRPKDYGTRSPIPSCLCPARGRIPESETRLSFSVKRRKKDGDFLTGMISIGNAPDKKFRLARASTLKSLRFLVFHSDWLLGRAVS